MSIWNRYMDFLPYISENTCYEMAFDRHGTNINQIFSYIYMYILEFSLLFKNHIYQDTIMDAHVGYPTLKTPEQQINPLCPALVH